MNQGAEMRILFAGLCLVPIIAASDVNGGILKLGFSTGTTMQSEYKMRPDYATATVFAAERKDVPTFNQMWMIDWHSGNHCLVEQNNIKREKQILLMLFNTHT